MKLINRKDIKQRILWFSDIHFLEDNVENYLQIFLDKFIVVCSEINKEQNIDYVIISGDISNKGKKIEFDKFTTYILKPLFKTLKKSKLILLPGNHDLTIDNGFDYDKILNLDKENSKDFFLNNVDYTKFFENYTAFCKKNLKFLPKNIEEPYSIHFLYGLHKDDENKLLFVLLNSAWLSLSVKLLEHLINEIYINPFNLEFNNIKQKFNKKTLDSLDINQLFELVNKVKKELTKDAYKISFKTIEYGTQELFLDFLFNSWANLQDLLNNHDSYYTITVMHHPENHLKWNDRINPDSLFSYLKMNSDVILSSHEHIPKNYLQSHNANEALHLKSGPFIELFFNINPTIKNHFDEYNEDNLNNSAFSVLDINVTKKNINECKYVYKTVDKLWNKFDSKLFTKEYKFINLRHLDLERVFDKLNSINNQELLRQITNYKLNKVNVEIDAYKFKNELYVVNNESNFNSIDFEILKSTIKKNKIKKVLFVSIDVLVDNLMTDVFDKDKLNSFYKIENNDQNIPLGLLKKDLFKKFNNFRARFFNNLESNELRSFSSVSFTLILLPYWEIDRVL